MLVGEEPKLYKQILLGNCKRVPEDLLKLPAPVPWDALSRAIPRAICIDITAIKPKYESIELIAPFRTMWVEYQETFKFENGMPDKNGRVGQLVFGEKIENEYSYMAWFFVGINGQSPRGPIGGWLYQLDENGTFLRGKTFKEDVPDNEMYSYQRCRDYLFSALRFMNCKNVLFVEQHFTGKIEKLKQRKPDYKYYSLKISNIKKRSTTNKTIEQVGTRELPLHIVRGHYKRFYEKGLFNEHFGTFWWNPTYRGNQGKGVIGKNYLLEETKREDIVQ